MAAPIRVLFVVLVIGFLLIGGYDVLRNYEENQCEMTWMYQPPQYLPIRLQKKVRLAFPRYGLYIYGEGGYASGLQKTKFDLRGVPVLFIPGNSGSYKQVRSLGSVAQRKAQNINNFFHFNYFSVDLNEEFSGIYGNSLYDQTKFVKHCIDKILTLYKSSATPPKSVILVGHSMGGMVARALFTLPDFNLKTVQTIITQATPHQGIVLMPDYYVAQFYKEVNGYWRDHMNSTVKDIVVVSTGGGFRDYQIRQDLTSLHDIVASDTSISTSTMSVPYAWVSTDHLCSVWCRQMVLVTKRALFDVIDRGTKQESTDPKNKIAVFKNHFLSNPGSLEFLPKWEEDVELTENALWEEISTKQWSISSEKRDQSVYYMVPVSSDRDKMLVAVSNPKVDNWVFACKLKPGQKKCGERLNLSSKGMVIPPLYSNRKVIHIDLKSPDLKGFSHIVFVLPQAQENKAVLFGEIVSKRQQNIRYELPKFTNILYSFVQYLSRGKTVYQVTGQYTVFRNITIQGFSSIFKTYNLILKSYDCKASSDEHDGSVMKLHHPNRWEDTFAFIRQGLNGQIALKRQSVPTENEENSTQLHVYLQPGCKYELSIHLTILDFMGQFFRLYVPLVPCFIVINILMAFLAQLRALNRNSLCPSFLDSLNHKPYVAVLVAEVLRYLMNLDDVTNFLTPYKIPEDDSQALKRLGLWFRPLSFTLYVLALGVVTCHAYLLELLLKIAGKILRRVCCCPTFCSNLFGAVKYLLIIASVVASVTSCGTVGIVICYCLQLLKLLYLSCKCATSGKYQILEKAKFHFHFTIFLLQMWFVIFNVPSLLGWIKQLKFNARLEVDPSRVPSLLSCLAYLLLSHWDEPKPVKGGYSSVCVSIFVQVTGLVLYAVYSQYRISYVIACTLLCLAVPQALFNKAIKSKLAEVDKDK